ncbi:MAG: NAD-dependent glucose-6-phosphate dehydrogenase Azf [Candidatus Velthaea sp.]
MAKIAVTGAAGLIGRHLCESLRREHDVVGIDLHDADIIADVRDADALERAFAGCFGVVHLAGASTVDSTWDDVYQINIGGTRNAYEAALRAGVEQVVFASSNHAVGMFETQHSPRIYEPAAGIIVGTDAPLRPDSYYGVSKAFGEALGRYYSENFGLRVACVRIGLVRTHDTPAAPHPDSIEWLPHLNAADIAKRYAATWMSQRDLADLTRAIFAHRVPYAIVYGVSDNPTRFWDLEPGRAIFGFWPQDGARATVGS